MGRRRFHRGRNFRSLRQLGSIADGIFTGLRKFYGQSTGGILQETNRQLTLLFKRKRDIEEEFKIRRNRAQLGKRKWEQWRKLSGLDPNVESDLDDIIRSHYDFHDDKRDIIMRTPLPSLNGDKPAKYTISIDSEEDNTQSILNIQE